MEPGALLTSEAKELSKIADLCQNETKHAIWRKITSLIPFDIKTMKFWTDELTKLNPKVADSPAYEASHKGEIGVLSTIEQILFLESIIQNDEVSLIETPS